MQNEQMMQKGEKMRLVDVDSIRKHVMEGQVVLFWDDIKRAPASNLVGKVLDLKESYSDACGMCTESECENCKINDFIDQLDELLK